MEEVVPDRSSIEKLEERISRKEKEIEILGEIFTQIRSSLDLDFILHKILEQLDHYFSFKHSMILLAGGPQFLRVVASHGYDHKGIGAKVEIGKGVIGTAAKRKQTIRMGNINMRLRYIKAGEDIGNVENEIIIRLPGLPDPVSQVAIPLLRKDELVGVISIESRQTNIFKDEDEQIINLIASQAAIVIEQAALYETERKRFVEMEEMNRQLSDLTQTQQKTLNLFARYVPEPVIKKALNEKPESIYDGEQRDVALLFCDIRNFTNASEKLAPTQVVSLLNTFYSRMNEVIRQQKGVIIQFIGDEIFVIFGAPVPLVNSEELAVRCALGMISKLKEINEELNNCLGVQVQVGIGIHRGPVVTGNLGCEDKISYSVTGDAVNTAKRIETLTKDKFDSILMSHAVYEKTSHLIDANEWEPIAVKGKDEKIKVWELLGVRS